MRSVIYKQIITLWNNLPSKLRTEKLSLRYFIHVKTLPRGKKKNRDFDPDWPHDKSIFMVSVHIIDSLSLSRTFFLFFSYIWMDYNQGQKLLTLVYNTSFYQHFHLCTYVI